MPSITLTFANPIQDSLQVNDMVYYQNPEAGSTPVQMGLCTAVTNNSLTCNISGTLPRPDGQDFILFSKDNQGNTSALRGYFANVEMRNDDTSQCELYTVGTEVFESSK
tara:strand:+ start:190 stop:516 length:327 start_codon:yes stop_codon:yes gene_type:complete